MRRPILLLICAHCVAGAQAANAAILQYSFTATVNSFADVQGVFPGGFGIGTALTGTFAWDTDSALAGAFGDVAIYQDPANGAAALDVAGGGISITDIGNVSSADRNFVVTDSAFGDRFDRAADLSNVTFGGFTGTPDFSTAKTFSISLAAQGGQDPFASTAIPGALDPAQFDFTGGSFLDFTARNGASQLSRFSADINSFTAVPEPASAGLWFGLAAGLAAALRRWRSRLGPLGRSPF